MTVQERIAAVRDRTSPGAPRPSLAARARAVALALAAGAMAGLVGWLLVAVPVLLAWLADPMSTVPMWPAMGIAGDVWALAHHGVVTTPEVSVRLAPLVLTGAAVLLTRYAVRQVLADPPSASGPTRIGGLAGAWQALRATELVIFVLGYVGFGVVLALLTGLGQAPVPVVPLLPGLVLVATTGIVLALVREHRRQEHPTVDRALRWVAARIPVLVRRGLAPAGEALAGLMVASLLVVVVLLVVRVDRVLTLTTALDAGGVGVAVMTLGQLLLLPNVMLWALAWLVGSGVSVGTVHVSWAGVTGGDLPLIPVLATLPEPGPMPAAMWAFGAVPVLAGVWLGFRGARSAPRLASWWTKAQVALAASAWVAVAVLVLSWLSSGGLTPGLLGTVGVDPVGVTAALLGQLLVGAVVAVTVLHLARRRL
ncbi:cell division protein PerM [Ornithinimicrobium sediminis]|uniref:cell division protein PerM n=1 Tax=Ornithinimicrobium sediminis TaxID=2904603 RepID=UPI001E56FA2E|nr:DUF6350 family protein [Ornithinimicrobium sediminis]MCE0486393.1 DUF6350 family protein [Ornithinimicrobium sediminis]